MTQQDVMTEQFRDWSRRIKYLRADKDIKTPSLAVSLIKTEKLKPSVPKFIEDGRKNGVREPSSEWKQSGRVLQVLLPLLQEG